MSKFISLKDAIEASDIKIGKHDMMPFTESTDINAVIVITTLNENACAAIFKTKEFEEEVLLQIIHKRVVNMGLEDKVTKSAILTSILFGIDNPGKAVVYLMELLDYYDINKRPATGKDVMMFIYPDGFYRQEKFTEIVSNVVKPNLSTNCTIY